MDKGKEKGEGMIHYFGKSTSSYIQKKGKGKKKSFTHDEKDTLTSSCNKVFFMLSYFLKPLRSSVRRRRDISSPWFCNKNKII